MLVAPLNRVAELLVCNLTIASTHLEPIVA